MEAQPKRLRFFDPAHVFDKLSVTRFVSQLLAVGSHRYEYFVFVHDFTLPESGSL
ncbi:MAG: hypothetical protein ABI700_27205 [Chloroflexota bacterium]